MGEFFSLEFFENAPKISLIYRTAITVGLLIWSPSSLPLWDKIFFKQIHQMNWFTGVAFILKLLLKTVILLN